MPRLPGWAGLAITSPCRPADCCAGLGEPRLTHRNPPLPPVPAINVAFDVASQYRLALSQPSVCRHPDSYTFWTQVYQDPEKVLRYTAFVELMAPIFDMPTVTSVLLPNLDENTATGYGEGVVWCGENDKVAQMESCASLAAQHWPSPPSLDPLLPDTHPPIAPLAQRWTLCGPSSSTTRGTGSGWWMQPA